MEMNLSSILPLLLGGKNPEMAKILSAMNSKGGSNNDLMANVLTSLLHNQGRDKAKGETDGENPSHAFAKNEGQTELLMNLMSSMGKKKPPFASGLSTIQKIAPNDILGVLLKHFNRKQ